MRSARFAINTCDHERDRCLYSFAVAHFTARGRAGGLFVCAAGPPGSQPRRRRFSLVRSPTNRARQSAAAGFPIVRSRPILLECGRNVSIWRRARSIMLRITYRGCARLGFKHHHLVRITKPIEDSEKSSNQSKCFAIKFDCIT